MKTSPYNGFLDGNKKKKPRAKLECLQNQLGYASSFYIDHYGRASGRAFWWISDWTFNIVESSFFLLILRLMMSLLVGSNIALLSWVICAEKAVERCER